VLRRQACGFLHHGQFAATLQGQQTAVEAGDQLGTARVLFPDDHMHRGQPEGLGVLQLAGFAR
jgi:hypothetical protein